MDGSVFFFKIVFAVQGFPLCFFPSLKDFVVNAIMSLQLHEIVFCLTFYAAFYLLSIKCQSPISSVIDLDFGKLIGKLMKFYGIC